MTFKIPAPVGVKNKSGEVIDPTTEDTLSSVLSHGEFNMELIDVGTEVLNIPDYIP